MPNAEPMFTLANSGADAELIARMNRVAETVRAERPEALCPILWDMWTREAIYGRNLKATDEEVAADALAYAREGASYCLA